jgi:hypothetical protein
MRWEGHVARMEGGVKCIKRMWQVNLKGRNRSEQLGVNARIILEWILEKYSVKLWTRFIWLRIGTVGGLFSRRTLLHGVG